MTKKLTSARLTRSVALACCLGFSFSVLGSSGAFAETIAIPLGQQGKAWDIETPKMGMTKDQVEVKFGAPLDKSGPVGTPPIYTWDYPQFSVYFEGDYVIHSVAKIQPKN